MLTNRRWPGSAEQWPTWQWSSAPGVATARGSTADVTTYPSSSTGSLRQRAASTAAAIATSSAPPTSRSTSNGSVMPAIRATAVATASRLRARPSSSTPVPRPTQSAGSPSPSSGGDGRGGRGVADPHLADHQQIGVERFHRGAAGGNALLEAFDRQRRLHPNVSRGSPDAHVDRVARWHRPRVGERGTVLWCAAKRSEHRGGHLDRVLAHPRRSDAVIGGEDQRRRFGDRRRRRSPATRRPMPRAASRRANAPAGRRMSAARVAYCITGVQVAGPGIEAEADTQPAHRNNSHGSVETQRPTGHHQQ